MKILFLLSSTVNENTSLYLCYTGISGHVSLPILRAGPHILKIHAYNRKRDATIVKRGFVVNSDPNFCSLVLVNQGVIISEDGTSAVIQVRVYGPSKALSCELDGGLPFTCKCTQV